MIFPHSLFCFFGPFRNDGQRCHCIRHHIYHYTTPCEMVICDSDGMKGNHISHWKEDTDFSNKLLAIFFRFVLDVLHNSDNFFDCLNFELTTFYCIVNNENDVIFQVLTAASMMFRIVFWDVLPCKIIVNRRFRGAYCLHHQGWRQYTPLKFYTAVHPRRQFWTDENDDVLALYFQWIEKLFVQLLNIHGISPYSVGMSDLNPSGAVGLILKQCWGWGCCCYTWPAWSCKTSDALLINVNDVR
jgi:hypothetical protein